MRVSRNFPGKSYRVAEQVALMARLVSNPPVHQAVTPLASLNTMLGGPLSPVTMHVRDNLAHVLEVVLVILVLLFLQELDDDAS